MRKKDKSKDYLEHEEQRMQTSPELSLKVHENKFKLKDQVKAISGIKLSGIVEDKTSNFDNFFKDLWWEEIFDISHSNRGRACRKVMG